LRLVLRPVTTLLLLLLLTPNEHLRAACQAASLFSELLPDQLVGRSAV